MRHTTPLLTILTSMDMKVAPLHHEIYYIGSVSEGKAVTWTVISTGTVGTKGKRPGGSKVRRKRDGAGGAGGGVGEEEKYKREKQDNIMT